MYSGFDALIVGAGPAGAAAAIVLARAGWSVALVEKQEFPHRKVCGERIAASNLPLIAALGLGDAFDAVAGPALHQVALMRGSDQVLVDLPAAAHAQHRYGRALGRATFDTLLRDRALALGVTVVQPWSVRSIDGGPGAWRCLLHHSGSGASVLARARVAICAHGSWGTMPSDRIWQRRTRAAGDLLAFKANFLGAALQPGVLPIVCFDGGYGGMVVAEAGQTTVTCCIRRDRLQAIRLLHPELSAGAAVETLLQSSCMGVGRALAGAQRDGPWLATAPIAPGVRLGSPTAPLRIGNAAGEAHPILGEGISMALQSAWLMCTHLLAGAATRSVPDMAGQYDAGRRFAEDWRRMFGPRIRLAAALAQVAMRPAAASVLLSLARRWPGMVAAGARWGDKPCCVVDLQALAGP